MDNVKRIEGSLPVAAVAAVRLTHRPFDAWSRVPLERPRDVREVPMPLYAPLPQPSEPRDERDEKPAKPQRGVIVYDM